jgi:hypothetical protein
MRRGRIRPGTRALLLALVLATTACATAGGGTSGGVLQQRSDRPWPVRSRYHVDLWLHGFAMLQDDTAQVPFFRRGYREQIATRKNSANVITQLDLNRDVLRTRMRTNPELTNSQFLALYFGSWEDLYIAVQTFLQTGGDPRRASDARTQAIVATLAAAFPTAADREWVRTFATSMRDEDEKFYRAYWNQQQRERAVVLARLDTLWSNQYYPKLRGYLNGTRLTAGDFLVSLPLDGEGRTVTPSGGGTAITTSFPDNEGAAVEAIYVFAHEAASQVAGSAVNDNITPSEQRSGVGARYTSSALVRGGHMLLERVAPELADGYARYYLRSANASVTGDAKTALARTFPLPDTIRDALDRQLEVVLGGI